MSVKQVSSLQVVPDLTEAPIGQDHLVAARACLALAFHPVRREPGNVGHGIGQVKEKRFARPGPDLLFDPGDRLPGELDIGVLVTPPRHHKQFPALIGGILRADHASFLDKGPVISTIHAAPLPGAEAVPTREK